MKVAVYAIAKNEEQFVEKWIKSAWEADSIVLLDTGSSDNTVEIAKQLLKDHPGKNVVESMVFNPWRFDHARNYSLDLVPEDIDFCIALDMDEVLVPGWRDLLEQVPQETTRPRYKYVWSWNDDGSEGLVYGGDKIHKRHGYRWKHPVHEVLKPVGLGEVQNWVNGFEINHHPDSSKSRGQYFPLLKLAVEEDPEDDRNQFYLAREYYFHSDYENAIPHFEKFLTLSKWAPERAAAYRYMALMIKDRAESLLYSAVQEDPMRRENWFALANIYYNKKDWKAVIACCHMIFRVTEKPLDYLCDNDSWGWKPYDLMAIASYYECDYEKAFTFGKNALEKNPLDERLVSNMAFYAEKYSHSEETN
jgi:glycosyltransferase involved in cell wall biosynthesis